MERNKKGPLLAGFLIVLCILSSISVFAHPGRTDQNGGHWDRKNGTYHFHSGEHAGKSSGGGSSSSEYVPFTPPYDPPTNNPYRQDDTKDDTPKKPWGFWDVVIAVPCSIFALACAVSFVRTVCEFVYGTFLEEHLPRYKVRTLREKIKSLRDCRSEIAETDAKIAKLNKTAFTMNIFYDIESDGLPCDTVRNSHWGDSFTLYRTDRGEKLHRKYNCCSATNPVHAYWYRDKPEFKYLLCKKCALGYVVPDVPGYEDYLMRERAKVLRQTLGQKCAQLQIEIDNLHKKCNSRNTKLFIVFSKNNKKSLQEANREYCELKEEE